MERTYGFVRHATMVVGALLALVTGAGAQVSGLYRFTYVPERSGIDATLAATVSASGTLLGVYDAATNPVGTRTKPGIFGSFGSTENLPVAVQEFGVTAQGPIDARTTGSFDLAFDTAMGTAVVESLAIESLSGDSIEVPFSITLLTAAFRTRNPTATYPAIPLEVPLGSIVVDRLAFTQAGPAAGTITASEAGLYAVSVIVPVRFSLMGSVLDQAIEISDGTVIALPLNATVDFSDAGAAYVAQTPLDFDQSQAPEQALPEIPLSLPTLTEGVTADVVATLVLDEIAAALSGSLAAEAQGVPVVTECLSDFNQDGGVDGGDIVDFFFAWESGDSAADVNQDGGVDGDDVAVLFAAWERGC